MILEKLNSYEAKFIDENNETVERFKSILNGVIHDMEVIKDSIFEFKKDQIKSYEEFVMDLKDDFSPNILKLFLSFGDIYKLYDFFYTVNYRVQNSSIYVNVYGTPKYGELARDPQDILDSMRHSIVYNDDNEKGFDVDSNVAVFMYDKGFEMFPYEARYSIQDEGNSENNILAVDVNAAFVRLFKSKDQFGLEHESLVKDIRIVIFSKIISYAYNMKAITNLIYNKFNNDKSIFNDVNLYRLLELTLSRWAYSVTNNLTSNQEYAVGLDTLLDYVKAHAQVDIPEKGIFNLSNLGLNKLRGKEYMMQRSIDKYIKYLKEEYINDQVIISRNPYAMNLPMRNHRRIKTYRPDNQYRHDKIYPERLIAAYESWNPNKETSAVFNFFGMENHLKPTDPKFAEFRRKERQSILSKLTSIERKRYTDIENDFIILKAEVTNASTVDTQKVLIKRCAMLRDIVNLELDRTNNEYLSTLLYALDSDIFSLQSDLSDRNVFKERNTRLYGIVKPNGKWDY